MLLQTHKVYLLKFAEPRLVAQVYHIYYLEVPGIKQMQQLI